MAPSFSHRTRILIGDEGLTRLAESHVWIAGLGGVGGYAAEALCRAGIGRFSLIDPDVVSPSNANRQLLALQSTMGQKKVELMAARMKDINPSVELAVYDQVLTADDIAAGLWDWDGVDYVIDAIDDVKAKLALLINCLEHDLLVISAMGAGNSMDHRSFEIADISKTHHCPLAKAVRLALRKAGYDRGVKVVYKPLPSCGSSDPCGTISYVPGILGLMLAGEAIQDLLTLKN